MIFRSRRAKAPGPGALESETDPAALIAIADAREAEGKVFPAIEAVRRANSLRRGDELERRLVRLRHRAGVRLTRRPSSQPSYPQPASRGNGGGSPGSTELPVLEAGELTPERVRAAILERGCVLVPGLISSEEARILAGGIDRTFDAREAAERGAGPDQTAPWFEELAPERGYSLNTRGWVNDTGGVWAADSPRMLFEVLETFERAGLRELVAGYLGERPALSVDKCLLRRVAPTGGAEWHQDGAFLGKETRALNVWMALSPCGRDAPGLDVVPRRFEDVVETGTEGAVFGWSVSPQVVERVSAGAGVVRPAFEPGDTLLFDHLFLHRTATEPEMPNSRYAIESWFFGPSAFPKRYVPVAF